MKDISDVLTVTFDNGLKDEAALCVSRKRGEKIDVLKMELGEQADILYHLLTEQMTKAEIKAESEIEKRRPCINNEDGCEEWAGCPCIYYKAKK